MLNTRRRSTLGALAIGSTLILSGCVAHDSGNDVPDDYGHEWFDRMSRQFAGDHGGGGGRLLVDDEDEKQALLGVALQFDLVGSYDVIAVCSSPKTVHLVIHDFTNKHDESGDSMDMKSRIGETDINCGATTRIPIEVAKGRDGVMFEATTTDTSERALFDAFIVGRGSDK